MTDTSPDLKSTSPGTENSRSEAHSSFALFRYGFRPFFMLAGLYATLAIPGWMIFLNWFDWSGSPLPPLAWHAHEMIYGFVMAAIAGFLLTAIPSWTGRRGFAGMPLIALVVVWFTGRAAVTLPLGLSPVWIAIIDLAFPVVLALAIVPSLVRSNNRRNLVFIGFLALLFISNLQFHLAGAVSTTTLHLAVNTVLLMVALVGGRIIPAFTSARLKQRGFDIRIPTHPVLDIASLFAVVIVVLVDIVFPGGKIAGATAALAAASLGLRLARWQGHRTIGEPILWILHVAYAWLPVALVLKAMWLLGGLFASETWLHALTVGAFATMILAVMSRAALGHSGRTIVASRSATIAYLLLFGAALSRVFGPTIFPNAATVWLAGAAAFWTTAFALFLFTYAPILCGPRVDGRPG